MYAIISLKIGLGQTKVVWNWLVEFNQLLIGRKEDGVCMLSLFVCGRSQGNSSSSYDPTTNY